MGQTIDINGSRRIGDVLVIDADRSLSGQDPEAFGRGEGAGVATFPARLAERLFEVDGEVVRVHVISNAVSIQRRGGWTDETADAAEQVLSGFFRFYPD